MKSHLKKLVLVGGLVLSGPLWAVDSLLSVKTEAEVRDPLTTPVIQAELSVELEGFPPEPVEPIVVSWQEYGGIDPEPFLEISIPGGCLSDSARCAVEGIYSIDGVETPLTIQAFDARFFMPDERTTRFHMAVSFLGGDQAHDMLSTLGGRTVELTMDGESATAPISEVEAAMGIQPQPFEPVR